MVWIDARLPLRFGTLDSRKAGEAVLTDGAPAAAPAINLPGNFSGSFRGSFVGSDPAHALDCTCCTPRSAVATALAALFRDRAIAAGPAFRGVLAVVGPGGEAAIRAALETDPIASARYGLA